MKVKFLLLTLLFTVKSFSQTASFNITYTNFSPQAQQAFDKAADNWANVLVSSVPIKINAYFVNGTGFGFLGVAITNGVRNFPNAPLQNTWYPASLADALAGTDLQPNETDIDIYLDSTANWYFGVDGNPSGGTYDFIDVAMHEIGHGLGFYSAANLNQQGEGSISKDIDFFVSILASFTVPDLEGQPFIFDQFVEDNNGNSIVDTLLYPNPSAALAMAFQSNNLYFDGINTTTATGGSRARLYAPATFDYGSSYLHLNEATYPTGTPDAMMTPFSAAGEAIHAPGPLTKAILQDLGWTLNPITSTDAVNGFKLESKSYPNPFADRTVITYVLEGPAAVSLKIYDTMGREVRTLVSEYQDRGVQQIAWNGQDDGAIGLPSGIYIYRLQVKNQVVSNKLYLQNP